jgi:hypothetical protein
MRAASNPVRFDEALRYGANIAGDAAEAREVGRSGAFAAVFDLGVGAVVRPMRIGDHVA